MIKKVYELSLTSQIVVEAFHGSGLGPINSSALLKAPLPKSANEPDDFVDSAGLTRMVLKRRDSVLRGYCLQPLVLRRGNVKMARGLRVTNEKAIEINSLEVDWENAKVEEKCYKESQQETEVEETRRSKRIERERLEMWAMERCTRLSGEACIIRRPLKVHISVAKHRRAISNHA